MLAEQRYKILFIQYVKEHLILTFYTTSGEKGELKTRRANKHTNHYHINSSCRHFFNWYTLSYQNKENKTVMTFVILLFSFCISHKVSEKKMVHPQFNPNQTSKDAISKAITKAGHDTDKY